LREPGIAADAKGHGTYAKVPWVALLMLSRLLNFALAAMKGVIDMSESSIDLSVVFDNENISTDLENLLIEAKETILTAFKNSNELYLHDFLNQKNQNMGISFDSWWVIEKIMRSDNIINISLSGSPSGTKEQDIITWFRKKGATKVNGRMTVDGGGDVESWDVGDVD
jgi:hypothetical protein